MSTRNLIMVVDRKHSSDFQEGFALHPNIVNEHSYVNMYMHHDGYPEWQGIQIANWLLALNNGCQDGSRLASKLVHDMYYDSCYLQRIGHFQSDIEYIYIIWTGNRDKINVSCWHLYTKNPKCLFVLKPEKIISKYMDDMEYTDFEAGITRYEQQNESFDVRNFKKLQEKYKGALDLLSQIRDITKIN